MPNATNSHLESLPSLFERESQNSFTDRPFSKVNKFYLSGELKNPEEYIQWFEHIRNASENDIIVIHINSEGGNLFTAIQFLRVMKETKALTIASVEGMCMSAATLIFLSAMSHEITDHSVFLFHNFSTMMMGKGHELYDLATHSRTWSSDLLKDVYKNFLTAEEISSVLDGKDLYMTSQTVVERMKSRQIQLQESMKKPLETVIPKIQVVKTHASNKKKRSK